MSKVSNSVKLYPSASEDSQLLDGDSNDAPSYAAIQKGQAPEKKRSGNVISDLVQLVKGPQRIWSVLLFSLIAALASVSTGMTLGYSSPAGYSIQKLMLVDSYCYRLHLWNSWAESIFGSVVNIGAACGALFVMIIADKIGRKNALVFSNFAAIFGWMLIICASEYQNNDSKFVDYMTLLIIGRLLTGFSAGWSSFAVPMYIVEISPAVGKGLFGSLNQFAVTIGIFAVQAVGIGPNFYQLALLPMAIILVFTIASLVLKETPRWLVYKNHGDSSSEADSALQFFRGVNYQSELKDIENDLASSKASIADKVKSLFRKPASLSLFFTMFLMVFQQVCGINAIMFYASKIFESAGLQDQYPNIATAFGIGLVQIVATFVSVVIIDILGRKILLLIGSCGSFLSTVGMGVYFILKLATDVNVSVVSWLPIVFMAIFIISFSLGWGPVPWVMVNELSPIKVKATIAGVGTAMNWSLSFVVTFVFEIQGIKDHSYVMWFLFALMSLVSAITVLFIPETKGKSLKEIEHDLSNYTLYKGLRSW